MHIDVTSMVRPRGVAVIGASAKRTTQGNMVIRNLKDFGYSGAIVPVHPQVPEIEGLAAVNVVSALPAETDTVVVAIPAVQVLATLEQLEQGPVRSAIIYSNGFTAEQERALRAFGEKSRLILHGPNCMGLINFTNSTPLYPTPPSSRLRPGKVAIVAQSGSAAISIMNSIAVGLSKVVTMGSEFQVTSADYIRWLADDDATTAIGVVAESIKDPVSFAHAAEAVHTAGKSLVVLKVGRSEAGLTATQAHTGAMVSAWDAYQSFFAATDIATVADYDELIATLECAALARRMVPGKAIGIVGISGGQTALSCDIAEVSGIKVAKFGATTATRIRAALPGSSGNNPIDIGATVRVEDRKTPEAIAAVLDDEGVGALVVLQDLQESLNPATLAKYDDGLQIYLQSGKVARKPFVVISPTSENVNPDVRSMFAQHGVPLLRGLTPGLRAVGNLASGTSGPAGAWANTRISDRAYFHPSAEELRCKLAAHTGALPPDLSFSILHDYGIPLVRARVVRDANEALSYASEVGFPMVVKVASRQVQHRSDVGGVVLDVHDEASLTEAIATIERRVKTAMPHAVIDGYELQEQVVDGVEAMAGFTAAAPFGPLMVLGSGGTLVELNADRAVQLAPLEPEQAAAMLMKTKLHRVLSGYRNLIPQTDTSELVTLAVNLSRLANDLNGVMLACDLNPVVVRKGTGEVRVVDALCVCR